MNVTYEEKTVEHLKKLRRKAELCRYSHSKLKEKFQYVRNWKELIITLLALLSAGLIGFYFRGIFSEEVLLFPFIITLFITLLQTLDNTVFKWTQKLARHESAVEIWGWWIREADFVEKFIQEIPENEKKERIENIIGKYGNCMSNTEQIPNNNFLKFKKNHYQMLLKSKELDKMIPNRCGD